MSLVEINFDGIIGPSHNYAGLSHGNLAATRNRGEVSHPRAAALQGIAKMRANLALGLTQAILLPHARPDRRWLESLATTYEDAAPPTQAQSLSASAMWAANAATGSPAPVAKLVTMPHRSHEWPETLAQLRLAFANPAFAVHGPVPAPFGDEGAANHMRLATAPGAPAAIRPAPCSSSNPRKRSPPAPSTTMSSRSQMAACCSRTNRLSRTRPCSTNNSAPRCPKSRLSRSPPRSDRL